jgi:hypothetical protein
MNLKNPTNHKKMYNSNEREKEKRVGEGFGEGYCTAIDTSICISAGVTTGTLQEGTMSLWKNGRCGCGCGCGTWSFLFEFLNAVGVTSNKSSTSSSSSSSRFGSCESCSFSEEDVEEDMDVSSTSPSFPVSSSLHVSRQND